MVRLKLSIDLSYQVTAPGCDFIFNVHAAQTARQTVVEEHLVLNQPLSSELFVDPFSGNRCLRLRALSGPLRLHYDAIVDISHHVASPEQLSEVSIEQLPASVLGYIYPSRYCQSDRIGKLAIREFGHLWQGYARVRAIQDWVRQRVAFVQNTSNGSTSALDTLVDQVGVCRDFAHLMIALCRAVSIPARIATGIDYGADPALGPTDFHAYVEVFVGGRWYLFDPSGTAIPMGFLRIGTGRDAADVAFATIFGSVQSEPPRISVQAIADAQNDFEIPQHRHEALSTDDGPLPPQLPAAVAPASVALAA